MKTFQIEQKSDKTSRKHVKTEVGEFHHDRRKEKNSSEKEAKEKIRNDAHPDGAEKIADTKEKIVNYSAENAARHTDKRNKNLVRIVHFSNF